MKSMQLGVTGLAVSQEDMAANWDEWKRLSKRWTSLDRVYITEKQIQDLAVPLLNSDYSNSDTLLQPSIPEFTAVIQERGAPYSTYVCFRKTLLKSGDVSGAQLGGVDCEIIPLIDAYVYINNRGAFCNTVVTIAKSITEHNGRALTGSIQFPTYRHHDPFTEDMLEKDPLYFHEFARSLKLLYMAIQTLSTERPEVLSFGRESASRMECTTSKSNKRKRKQHNARFVKVIRISEDAPTQLSSALAKHSRKMECPCWGVAGHWRTYKKSGKRVWIAPYRKGRDRHNPEAYQPKNYLIPKEA